MPARDLGPGGEGARPAGKHDVEVLATLAESAIAGLDKYRGGELAARRWSDTDLRSAFENLLGDDRSTVYMGTFDGVAVGFATCIDKEGIAEVHGLFVHPEAREVGIGEALLDAIEAWAIDRRLEGITAEALPGDRMTKNFFETFGLVAHRLIVHRSLAAAR